MKPIRTLMLVAGVAVAAPAFADTVTYAAPAGVTTYYLYDPISKTYIERQAVIDQQPAAPSLSNMELTPAPAPTVTYVDPGPAQAAREEILGREEITITAPRLTEDQRITEDVVDRIASDPKITGQVGVETYRNTVRLTGKVRSPQQVDQAATDARSVPGVREVNNEIRSRMSF